MGRSSAGILMYRLSSDGPAVLLAHPGGPYWAKRDTGAWSIPKGEMNPDEDARSAAIREFTEELGTPPRGELEPLGEIRQAGGKRVIAFAVEGDFDVATLQSNTFDMPWPPHSGRMQSFPEVDRAAWLAIPEAREKMLASQLVLLDRLEQLLSRA